MASEQTRHNRGGTDDIDIAGTIEGLDITVDVCSQPEFDICKLYHDIDEVR